MNFADISNLAAMLDPNKQHDVTSSSSSSSASKTSKFGYSLAEAPSERNTSTTAVYSSSSSAMTGGGGEGEKKPTGAPAHPGFVSLPPQLAHKQKAAQEGLPVPSLTKEGRELRTQQQQSQENRLRAKPTGNDIWAAEEIDPNFGAGAGQEYQKEDDEEEKKKKKNNSDDLDDNYSLEQQQQEQNKNNSSSSSATAAAASASSSSSSGVTTTAEVAPVVRSTKNNKRVAPDFDIVFKHQVSAEDRFLAMDFTRDGSASTADALVVKIQLPKQESARDVDLDVQEEALSLLSPFYQLRAPLPMKVLTDPAAIKATWEKGKKTLSVTLKADTSKREFMLV